MDDEDASKQQLELSRLRLERSRLALEVRLKKRELQHHSTKTWRSALANPLVLAIVGGSITLLTSIITNFLSSSATRESDERRATLARDAEARALQSDLIKTFLKTQDSKTARDNLTFLIESGLIPEHEQRITAYLDRNAKAVPKLGEATTAASSYPGCTALDMGGNASGPVGVSIHLATNRLDPGAYGGWNGQLENAVPDANAMQKLAAKLGYRTNLYIDALARSDCLASALKSAATRLDAGDSLLLTLSGHGGQIPDPSNQEPDKKIETWVLHDKQLSAYELHAMLARFKPGVTIVVVQDISYAAPLRAPKGAPELAASLFVLAGSKEGEVAFDGTGTGTGTGNGAFTGALLSTWNNGQFSGSYADLMAAVRSKMPAKQAQTPQLYLYGPARTARVGKPFALTERSGQ
jgi:Caspase domain